MYRINSSTTKTRAPQLPQTYRNTNPRVSTSTGVAHRTNVSIPQPRSTQMKDKVVPNTSQVKFKKTEVEDHHRISSISNQTKSVTACNNSLNSRTSNVNVVCATCRICVFNSNHDACISKYLNDVNARTKKPKIVQLILFIVDSGCTKHMTGNLSMLCNFVEKYLGTVRFGNDQFSPILGYRDLVQGNITINMVYYVEDLQGNDLLTASPTQAWLWHRRLSHLNFDYINLLSKKDVMIGLPKLKYVKDQLCSSCEVSKAKRSSFKTKIFPSLKGRLNLLHMNLCGPMRVASINGKKYILLRLLPSTPTNVHAEENNDNQADDTKHEFPVQEVVESSSRNIGNSNLHTFNQLQDSEYRWTKDHPLTQVRGNPSKPVQTRRQLATDPKMCMFALTVSTAESKNIKEAMADSAWIEAMQEELHQFDRLQVWELVDKPFGKNVIKLKWLWKNKKDEDQTVIRNKE
ncbi:retrovirus-related pol polyprotein from transposon TNT 1-94 [Tanacetum coccineum]